MKWFNPRWKIIVSIKFCTSPPMLMLMLFIYFSKFKEKLR